MTCSICGSPDTKKKTFKEIIKDPFGSEELYYSTTIYCNVCRVSIDTTDDDQVIRAIQRSERNGLINMVKDLAKKGIKDGEIERVLFIFLFYPSSRHAVPELGVFPSACSPILRMYPSNERKQE